MSSADGDHRLQQFLADDSFARSHLLDANSAPHDAPRPTMARDADYHVRASAAAGLRRIGAAVSAVGSDHGLHDGCLWKTLAIIYHFGVRTAGSTACNIEYVQQRKLAHGWPVWSPCLGPSATLPATGG